MSGSYTYESIKFAVFYINDVVKKRSIIKGVPNNSLVKIKSYHLDTHQENLEIVTVNGILSPNDKQEIGKILVTFEEGYNLDYVLSYYKDLDLINDSEIEHLYNMLY